MEGCETCLIDASKVILFSAGQGGWSNYPILSHSIPIQAIIHSCHSPMYFVCSGVWKPYESPLLDYTVSQIDGLRVYGAPERESSPQYNGCCGWIA